MRAEYGCSFSELRDTSKYLGLTQSQDQKERDSNTASKEFQSLALPLSYLFVCDCITQAYLLLYPYGNLTRVLLRSALKPYSHVKRCTHLQSIVLQAPLNRITVISPAKKTEKKRSSMAPWIKTDRYSASGIELAAKTQRACYHEGLYPISNPRRIFSDLLTNSYVFELLKFDGVDIRQ